MGKHSIMTIRVRLTPTSHHVEFDIGSPEEGISFVEENTTGFQRLLDVLGRLPRAEIEALGGNEGAPAAGEPIKERKPRGPNKPKVDAVAPAPLAVPGAAPPIPPTPLNTAENANGLPAFLDRSNPAAVANAAPPPPVAPPAPPAPPAPAAPPSGVLAEKIIANLDKRKAGTPDNGQSLSDWLAAYGLVTKGATYAEAISCLRFISDAKLEPLLAPLEIAA